MVDTTSFLYEMPNFGNNPKLQHQVEKGSKLGDYCQAFLLGTGEIIGAKPFFIIHVVVGSFCAHSSLLLGFQQAAPLSPLSRGIQMLFNFFCKAGTIASEIKGGSANENSLAPHLL